MVGLGVEGRVFDGIIISGTPHCEDSYLGSVGIGAEGGVEAGDVPEEGLDCG
jgi:hypothetical protein